MPERPPAQTRNSGDVPRVGDERGMRQEEEVEEDKSHCAVSQQQHVGEDGFCSVSSSRGRIKKGDPNKDLQALVWSFWPVSRGLSRQRNRRRNSREMTKALGIRSPLGITSLLCELQEPKVCVFLIMGSFFLEAGDSASAKRREYGLLVLVFLLTWSPAAAVLSPKGVNYEVQALMGVKASLKDPHSVLENWDQDSVDPCSWTMVTCSPENLVIGLIVGNPLICATGSEKECFGTMPMPISYNLNNSETEKQHDEEVCLGNLKKFQFRELQVATDNFSSKNILGKGGFGIVYKGHLKDGTLVAVKRLKDGSAVGGEIQFQTEVEMISLAVHRNLLRLHGFCMTASERLLVYPYMSNGSVASRLKGKPPLDWITRKRIAVGAARGLLYLHEQCDPKIIHRDVKAANILLDDYCEAIVGDFGLAKLMDHRDSHVTTAVRGTVGHIAPEYLSTGQSSEKTDVFGFGILLLELITGRTALEFGKSVNEKGTMLDWVKKIHQEKKLDVLMDKNLKNIYDRIELEEMVQVALLCTQFLPGHRPKMSEVVRMLEGDGLVERWEASQRVDSQNFKVPEFAFSERCYSNLTDDSSLLVQAVELSGPRSEGLKVKDVMIQRHGSCASFHLFSSLSRIRHV
ncbi:hypothetical protein C4D60_Mb09t13390 [Musa balbisiana]|uniref:non-specific serine/threonine protein kinase n=1 Tax=Musa balbisiana TaxID=52838 RepID=A0A4S8IG37_MUSBA|nr:hypothetical protein C4D60_Mb09t13390 [Musa balbisiana]